MKVRVIPIGNSKGIRIPRALIEVCRIGAEVDLGLKGNVLVIRPLKRQPREGWDAAFNAMHERREDRLLLPETIDRELKVEPWE